MILGFSTEKMLCSCNVNSSCLEAEAMIKRSSMQKKHLVASRGPLRKCSDCCGFTPDSQAAVHICLEGNSVLQSQFSGRFVGNHQNWNICWLCMLMCLTWMPPTVFISHKEHRRKCSVYSKHTAIGTAHDKEVAIIEKNIVFI